MSKSFLLMMFALTIGISIAVKAEINPYTDLVDNDGNMYLPADLLTHWELVGMNGLMEEDKSSIVSLHSVFTQRQAAAYYRQNGEFADGTVLIKEIRNASMTTGTTGFVGYSDDVDVWFMMVKDTQGRFTDNPDWGEGWGWALFNGDDMKTNVSRGWEAECMGCHTPVKQQDWVHHTYFLV